MTGPKPRRMAMMASNAIVTTTATAIASSGPDEALAAAGVLVFGISASADQREDVTRWGDIVREDFQRASATKAGFDLDP